MDKVFHSFSNAVADIPDGATVFIDGFGGPGGMAHFLILALWQHGARDLTVVSNTAGITMAAGFGAVGCPPPSRPSDRTTAAYSSSNVSSPLPSDQLSWLRQRYGKADGHTLWLEWK